MSQGSDLLIGRVLRPVLAGLLVLAIGVAGCQSRPKSDPFEIPTATPAAEGTPGPTRTPVPRLPYPIDGIPLCSGLKEYPGVLSFQWPNVEEALEQLEEYTWGYYECDLPAKDLEAFYHREAPKPPWLWEEVNGADHVGGHVRLYYQRFQLIWIYIWMLPRDGGQHSYLVIAKGDPGEAQTWECLAPLWQRMTVTARRRSPL